MDHNKFIKQLDEVKELFRETKVSLSTYQKHQFEECFTLLREDELTPVKGERREDRRKRTRTLLADVFLVLGSEVFLLCTLAASITKLSEIRQRKLIPALQKWWNDTAHPQGLTETAAELCRDYSISTLVSAKKRNISEVSPPVEAARLSMSPGMRRDLEDEVTAHVPTAVSENAEAFESTALTRSTPGMLCS